MPTPSKAALSVAVSLILLTACGPRGGAAFKDLPPKESLDCAANIYAVVNEMDPKTDNPDIEFIKSNGLAAMTHYATIYAEAEGLGSQGAIGMVKLKAYRMTGKISGGSRVSAPTIIARAKTCLTADAA